MTDPHHAALTQWWDKLVVSLELADLNDPATCDRLDSAAAKANNQGFQTAAAWHYARARPMLTAAAEIWTRLGHAPGAMTALNARGAVARKLGDYAAALDDHETALALAEEYGLISGAILALTGMGAVYVELNESTRAVALLNQAFEASLQDDDTRGAAGAQHVLGLTREACKEWDAALAAYGAAVERWRTLPAPVEEIESSAGVARVMLSQGQTVAAYALIETVLEHLGAHGPTRLDEPLRVYWTIYRVLYGARYVDEAHTVLETAYHLLQEQADGLTEAQRTTFCEGVAVNHAIVKAWRDAGKRPPSPE